MAKKLSMAAQEHAGYAFAAQLLSLDALSSSHLKKETLSPWVVHAHHCGLEYRAGMPPPPTIAVARPPSTLRGVFELEGAIESLHETLDGRPACLHLVFRAKTMVLWLHSHDKFLLYVCPAKVKVLKTLSEVVVKMTEDVLSDEPCTLRLVVATSNQTDSTLKSSATTISHTGPVESPSIDLTRLASPCPTQLETTSGTIETELTVEKALSFTPRQASPSAKLNCSPTSPGHRASLSRSDGHPQEALGTHIQMRTDNERTSVENLLPSALALPDAPLMPSPFPSPQRRVVPNQDDVIGSSIDRSAGPDKSASIGTVCDSTSPTTFRESERSDGVATYHLEWDERRDPRVDVAPVQSLSPFKAASSSVYPLPNYKAKLGATAWALLELQAAALATNTTGVLDRRRQSSASLPAAADQISSHKSGLPQHPRDAPRAKASLFAENDVAESPTSRGTEPDPGLNDAVPSATAPLTTPETPPTTPLTTPPSSPPSTPPSTPPNVLRSMDTPVPLEGSHFVMEARHQVRQVEVGRFEPVPLLPLFVAPSVEMRLGALPETPTRTSQLSPLGTSDQSSSPSLTHGACGMLGAAASPSLTAHDASKSVRKHAGASCDQPSLFSFAPVDAVRTTTSAKKMTFQDVRALRQSVQSRRETPWLGVDRTEDLATHLALQDEAKVALLQPNNAELANASSLCQQSPVRNEIASNLAWTSAQHRAGVSEPRTPPAVPPRRRCPPPLAADSPPPSPPKSPPPPQCSSALTLSEELTVATDEGMAQFVPHSVSAREDTTMETISPTALEAALEHSIEPLADTNPPSSTTIQPRAISPFLTPIRETARQPTSVDLHFVGVEAPPTLDRSQRLAELRAEKIKAQRLRQLETRRLQIQARAPLDDPKVAASKPSNRQLIQNAIEYTLLAGVACEKERTKVLGVLATHPSENFVVALKGSALDSRKMTYRGLYVLDPASGVVSRVLGSGPSTLDASNVIQFFRYNSGKKAFVGVSTRSFTVATDAAAVPDDCFRPLKTKRPSYL
ncbi:hypothetical protein SDRG_00514 [Saprolegnia diclina VS20]|uniref:CKK domain-containing protein n=1 Tax=Saprolegnia diclina (strain VS20) TaxID=1156394 RepID=T0SBJ3_SAPDV|nr:hypothetical protein SDRG_00514 [Saprolegnia diclina VS20]EQC42793.1 hypothetical protein SDRG_00514 [Saprolegnia diclina VS20]|eukprot:XP_008604216.1 hypothetical protein SDRG_00514 [Saprolegnia diclina VS20]